MDADVTGKHARRGGCEEPTSLLLGSDRPACSAPEPESSRCPPLQRGQPCSGHGWRCRQLAELAVSLRDAHHLAPTGARAVPSGASHEREGKWVASLLEGGKLFLSSPQAILPLPFVFVCSFFSRWVQAPAPRRGFYLATFLPFGFYLFLNITNVFCAKKRVGHACICPRMITG